MNNKGEAPEPVPFTADARTSASASRRDGPSPDERLNMSDDTQAKNTAHELESWQLVPKEPTQRMIEEAWADALAEDAVGVYHAMLDVAPKPPVHVTANDYQYDGWLIVKA